MTQQELLAIKQRFGIIGQSPLLNRDIEIAVQVARTDLSVLVTGESGVGKEHFPKIIHAFSARKHGAYFAVNCGAIPEGTIDSELFGHEKGAFTDAKNEHKGYFEIADGGTLFLDEVGELPLQTQVRLLRVLETGEFLRMGSSQVRKTNVRVVAATNLNMRQAIDDGRFREDLYYRLNTIPIQMPPLRDRGGDILLLFRLFAMQMAEKYRLPKITLTEEAQQIMLKYKWPGNVRQLKNITEQMSILSQRREITAQDLQKFIPEDPESMQLAPINKGGSTSYENEREILYKILYELRGNVSDLRRDMNNLRKQLDAARNTPIVSGDAQIPAIYRPSGDVQMPPQTPSVQDAVAEEIKEPETLNLSDIGRQMVEKALERNGGNRKKAAAELGISDRTLYRKIKQYGLES